MECLFYIGQRVVALNDQLQGYYKKGDEFEVLGIKQVCCSMCIQISPTMDSYTLKCDCGGIEKSSIAYFDQNQFAPLQEMGDMTFEEAVNLVTKKEMV